MTSISETAIGIGNAIARKFRAGVGGFDAGNEWCRDVSTGVCAQAQSASYRPLRSACCTEVHVGAPSHPAFCRGYMAFASMALLFSLREKSQRFFVFVGKTGGWAKAIHDAGFPWCFSRKCRPGRRASQRNSHAPSSWSFFRGKTHDGVPVTQCPVMGTRSPLNNAAALCS